MGTRQLIPPAEPTTVAFKGFTRSSADAGLNGTPKDRNDGHDAFLCEKCRTLHFTTLPLRTKMARLSDRLVLGRGRHVLFALGPFEETIDQTPCAFCRIARHAVELHDGHPTQIVLVCLDRGVYQIERHTEVLAQLADYEQDDSMYSNLLYTRTIDETDDIEIPPSITARDAADRAKAWLSDCIASHNVDRCPSGRDRGPARVDHGQTVTHFIDVYERQIVRANTLSASARFEPYFALSYVNGGANFLQLTQDNEAELCSPGSLSGDRIPRTFDDAMVFTRSCEVRYIWIDALCIRQGDEQEVATQIRKMGDIYHQSSLVIVAQLGSNPNFGLFARPPPEKRVRGVEFSSKTSSGRTTYHTRAWCFQEGCLANRTLTITADCLRFRCGSTVQAARGHRSQTGHLTAENVIYDRVSLSALAAASKMRNAGNMRVLNHDPQEGFFINVLKPYNELISLYLLCSLSYTRDIAQAFEGISALIMTSTGAPVFHGLPSVLFPMCLFWATAGGSRPTPHWAPSWSWTSVSMPAQLIRRQAIPFWSFEDRGRSMVRHFAVGTVSGLVAQASRTLPEINHITIDISRQHKTAPNAVMSRPPMPCTASDQCKHALSTLHFEALTLPTQGFSIQTKHDHGWDEDVDVLYYDKDLAGIVYGMDPTLSPWTTAPHPASSGRPATLFVPLAIIYGNSIAIWIRKRPLKDFEFKGEYYMSLIVSQEQGSVTCERIGLAIVKRSLFDEREPKQRLIHLV